MTLVGAAPAQTILDALAVIGDRDVISCKLIPRLRDERIFFRHALRAGFTIEEIFNLTKIGRWFLVQIKEIVDFEEELAGSRN